MPTTGKRVAPKVGPERVKRGIVVEIPEYEGSSRMRNLWLVIDGDTLAVTDEDSFVEFVFNERARVADALDAVLRKRKEDEYVPINPDEVPADWTPDQCPDDTPAFHRSGDGIVYTHECGEERFIPRATARELLAALSE